MKQAFEIKIIPSNTPSGEALKSFKRAEKTSTRKILENFGYNLSDEEIFCIGRNIRQLADVIVNFENKKIIKNKKLCKQQTFQ